MKHKCRRKLLRFNKFTEKDITKAFAFSFLMCYVISLVKILIYYLIQGAAMDVDDDEDLEPEITKREIANDRACYQAGSTSGAFRTSQPSPTSASPSLPRRWSTRSHGPQVTIYSSLSPVHS